MALPRTRGEHPPPLLPVEDAMVEDAPPALLAGLEALLALAEDAPAEADEAAAAEDEPPTEEASVLEDTVPVELLSVDEAPDALLAEEPSCEDPTPDDTWLDVPALEDAWRLEPPAMEVLPDDDEPPPPSGLVTLPPSPWTWDPPPSCVVSVSGLPGWQALHPPSAVPRNPPSTTSLQLRVLPVHSMACLSRGKIRSLSRTPRLASGSQPHVALGPARAGREPPLCHAVPLHDGPGHTGKEPGARMMKTVGGKDSYALLHLLHRAQQRAPFPFRLTAVHVDQGQPGYDGKPLRDWLEARSLPHHIIHEDTYSVVIEKTHPVARIAPCAAGCAGESCIPRRGNWAATR
jgi:hypothetical protein